MNAFDLENLRRKASGYSPDVEMCVKCADVLALVDMARAKPAETKRHRYFVAYCHSSSNNSFGNGWVEMSLHKPIRGNADLEFIRDKVIEQYGYEAVSITGWQRFEEE